MSPYHHTIPLKKNGVRLKSFLAPKPFQNYKPPLLPLLQGSLPKNKGSWGNNFWRRICQRGSKIHSSSKTPLFWKNHWFRKKVFPKKVFRHQKMKSCKSSETRFAKVSRRSEPCSRGKRPFKVSIFFFWHVAGRFFFLSGASAPPCAVPCPPKKNRPTARRKKKNRNFKRPFTPRT